jgi:hypothetical protein
MRTAGVLASVAMLTILSATAVFGASRPRAEPTTVIADVDGRPIKIAQIATFWCHDFDYPKIHCFRSAKDLEEAKVTQFVALAAVSPSFAAGDYVTIFDGQVYTGGAIDLSQSYDALWSIGWNDRVSSYKGRNSVSGKFWTDWYSSGTARSFCCNANVSSLPGNLDNAFSSVYRL